VIQDGRDRDRVTLLSELISVSTGLHWMPIVYSNSTPRHNTVLPSFAGDDLGEAIELAIDISKWQGGALATDGVMYCIPYSSEQILVIDPFKELAMTMHNHIIKYPEELGQLFVKKDDGCNETFYGSAVRKFGIEKVFKFLVEECLPSDKEWADTRSGNLPLFMVAASCENCTVSVIYHLLRRNVHDLST
jgi:hypothetical protein